MPPLPPPGPLSGLILPRRPPPPGALTTVELFAGCGGLALGLHRAGWTPRLLVEWDGRGAATLRRNFPAAPLLQADANHVPWARYRRAWGARPDLVCGGPPCQPFSEGGWGRGEDDERDGWPAFQRAVEALEPTWVLAENVPGMERHPRYLNRVFRWFDDRFAWAALWRLDARDYGAPQRRHRVFLVAGPEALRPPEPTHAAPAAVGGLLASLTPSRAPWRTLRDAWGLGPDATAIESGHGYLDDRPCDLDSPGPTCRTFGVDVRVNEAPGLLPRELAVLGRYVPTPEEREAWGGGEGSTCGTRLPYAHEYCRLQGFPDDWFGDAPFASVRHQVGNAIAVPVAAATGEVLARAERRRRGDR